MMKAKEIYLARVAPKAAKHPKTAPRIICFSLAMALFGLSVILIGLAHAPIYGNNSAGWVKTVLMIEFTITLQATVALSAVGVTSSRYTLHAISSTVLALALAFDVALGLYYFIWVI